MVAVLIAETTGIVNSNCQFDDITVERKLARNAALEQLMEQTQLEHTACYQALRAVGKFGQPSLKSGFVQRSSKIKSGHMSH